MNRRRNETKSSGFPIFALLVGAAIVAAGGVLHVYYKNSQIQREQHYHLLATVQAMFGEELPAR